MTIVAPPAPTVEGLVVSVYDPHPDPLGEAPRFPVRDAYFDTFWLPVLGPSTICVVRYLGSQVAHGGFEVSLCDLGRALGLAGHPGEMPGTFSPHSPLKRTLKRALGYSMAIEVGGTFAVRTEVPMVPRRYRRCWPASLHQAHRTAYGVAS